MEYEKFHILDFVIDDEQCSKGCEITVFVDTLEMVNIEIGNSLTLRTNESGLMDIRDALHRAALKIDQVCYDKTNEKMSIAENKMIQAGVDARDKRAACTKLNDQQDNNTWNPSDPTNW